MRADICDRFLSMSQTGITAEATAALQNRCLEESSVTPDWTAQEPAISRESQNRVQKELERGKYILGRKAHQEAD